MGNLIIRYAEVEHSPNLYQDYVQSGLLQDSSVLTKKGLEQTKNAVFKLKKIGKIYYSPKPAAKQTAELLSEILRVPSEELALLENIKHDFSKLTNFELWKENNPGDEEMYNLRKNFILQFMNDELLESKQAATRRIITLMDIMTKEKNSLFISHGIFIKMFYLYCRTHFEGELAEILNKADLDKTFYGSLSGIEYQSLKEINLIS